MSNDSFAACKYACMLKQQLKDVGNKDMALVMAEASKMYMLHAIGVEVELRDNENAQFDFVVKFNPFQDVEFHETLIDCCDLMQTTQTDDEYIITVNTLADSYTLHGLIHYIY